MAFLDPSLFVLFFFAITCIIHGSSRSYSFHTTGVGAQNKELANEVSSLKLRNIIIFVIMGSITLLLLFFLFKYIYYVLLVLVTVISALALFFVISPVIEYVFERVGWNAKSLKLPVLPAIPYSVIVLSLLCISIIVLWIITGYWLVVNCMAWCIGVTQLSLLRLPSLKISVALLSAFLLYDVFWVFISPYIFGESVMVAVATQMPVSSIPMTLSMPHILDSGAYSLLGLGDIVLPGLFICFTYGFEKSLPDTTNNDVDNDIIVQRTTRPKVSYFVITLIGYTVGFGFTLLSFMLMKKGQPALLYLVPCTVLPVIIVSYFHGHLRLMWQGIPKPKSPQDIEDQALLSLGGDDDADTENDVAAENKGFALPTDSTIVHVTVADVIGSSSPNINENNNSV